MRQVAFLSLLLVLGLTRAADAQTVASVLRDAGIVGTWAADCAAPPSGRGDNAYSIYAATASGAVTLTYNHGPSVAPTVYMILRAERRATDRVVYLQENQNDRSQLEIELSRDGDRIKVLSSRRTTGEVLVADGKFTSDGTDSPWQARCPN